MALATAQVPVANLASFQPTPPDLCGKGTRVGYNSTVKAARVIRFFCGRWDCPRCADHKRGKYKAQMLSESSSYYTTIVDETRYEATMKKIRRAKASYWAILWGNKVLILTQRQVLPESIPMAAGSGLEEMLDLAMQQEDKPMNGRKKVRSNHKLSGNGNSVQPSGSPISSSGTWDWVTVQESPEQVCRTLESVGCLVSRQGTDRAQTTYLSPKGQRMIEQLLGINSDPPTFTKVPW